MYKDYKGDRNDHYITMPSKAVEQETTFQESMNDVIVPSGWSLKASSKDLRVGAARVQKNPKSWEIIRFLLSFDLMTFFFY